MLGRVLGANGTASQTMSAKGNWEEHAEFDQLNTILVEVEAIINSRPLTYMYDDVEGVSYCISPSHLLYGRRIVSLPNSEVFEVTSTYDSLVKKSKQQRHTLNQFLLLWRRMYLTNLREHHSVKE